MFNFPEVCVCL